MYLKKFVVSDLQAGWLNIYKELGEDAVIISVKDRDGKFEIIAASPIKENKEDLVKKIQSEFKSDEDVQGIEDILSLALKLKDAKQEIKELVSNFINSLTSNLTMLENPQKLIEEKTCNRVLEKKFINIIGGTSTGKSTTAVKITANLKFNKGKNVALASMDYFKVGSFETLRKFCEIMQVPFFQIKSKKEFILLKDELERYDHIVIDTPGNIEDTEEIHQIVKILSEGDNTENILTVALDKKETVIRRDLEKFKVFNISSVILTKFDEVDFEEFLLTLANIPYKVSFIANGLNVPNDLVEMRKLTETLEAYYERPKL